MDVDVWKKTSKFDQGVLKRACEKVGIAFNPISFAEPDQFHPQLVESGIVQLGEFEETAQVAQMGSLMVVRPPIENVISSKLVCGDVRDYDDIVFLVAKCSVTKAQIEQAVSTIRDKMAREATQKNLVLLDCVLGSGGKPKPSHYFYAEGVMGSSRDRHVFVIEFLVSGRAPGELLAEKRVEEAKAVIEMIRNDPPMVLAQTDPALYERLCTRITELRIAGWGTQLREG